jgi:hypothetical protein
MGRRFAQGLLVALLALPARAESHDQEWTLRLTAGRTSAFDRWTPDAFQPVHSLGAVFEYGAAGGLEVGRTLTPRIQVVADLEHARFEFDPENRLYYSHPSNGGWLTGDGDATALSLDVAARISQVVGPTRKVTVRALAGGGPTRVSYALVRHEVGFDGLRPYAQDTPIQFRDTAPSFVLGLGTDFQVGRRTSVGIDWRYRHAFVDRHPVIESYALEGARYGTVRVSGVFLSVTFGLTLY